MQCLQSEDRKRPKYNLILFFFDGGERKEEKKTKEENEMGNDFCRQVFIFHQHGQKRVKANYSLFLVKYDGASLVSNKRKFKVLNSNPLISY
jgi:hypothetical protein